MNYLTADFPGLTYLFGANIPYRTAFFSAVQYNFDDVDGPSFRLSIDLSLAALSLDDNTTYPALGNKSPYQSLIDEMNASFISYNEYTYAEISNLMHTAAWDNEIDEPVE